MQVGRPLKFKTVEELDQAINGYFDNTPKDEWTWTGLALYLDTSRQTLINYKERPEFFDSIKKGLERVENGYEIDLKKSGRTGTIFALKNFDWKDKNETDITSAGKPIIQVAPEILNKNEINTSSSTNSERQA
jgi:hypothetical protein